ncbi:MAG: hypothetical protein KIG14_00155 [Candidatus Sacchiramonaceae bacterium]|nr:hypothetical protein [Candidatus Saccharimonadaceae bacterium]
MIKGFSKAQTEAFNRKLVGVLVAAVGILLVFGVGIVARFADLAIVRQKIKSNSTIEHTTRKISGMATCLPQKSSQDNRDVTQECAVGIRTQDGDYYAVGSNGGNPIDLYGEIGSGEFEVEGEFIKAGTEETYDIIGTIIP